MKVLEFFCIKCAGVKITVGHLVFADQFSIVATHFLVCLTYFRSNKVSQKELCVEHLPLLLGDKQARRDVYILVYGVLSYLIYLLATGFLCYIAIRFLVRQTFGQLVLIIYCYFCINMLEQHQTKLHCVLTKFNCFQKVICILDVYLQVLFIIEGLMQLYNLLFEVCISSINTSYNQSHMNMLGFLIGKHVFLNCIMQ